MTKINKDPDTTVGKKRRERDTRTRGVRKPYAKRACVPCKKAHAGCDNNRPCRRCVTQGIEHMCVDAERRRSTTPRKPRKSSSGGRRSSSSSSTSIGDAAAAAGVSDSLSEISAEDQQKSKRRKSTNSIGVDSISSISSGGGGGGSSSGDSRRGSESTASLSSMADAPFRDGDDIVATSGLFTGNDLLMMPGFDALLMPQPSSQKSKDTAIDSVMAPELGPPIADHDTSLSFDAPGSLENMEDTSSYGTTNIVPQGDQLGIGGAAGHHSYSSSSSSSSSLTVPSEMEKFRNTFTVNMLPYLIKGLANAANTATDPHRLQQVHQQQQQLLQFLPSIRNITPEQREILMRQLQNDIANSSHANMGDVWSNYSSQIQRPFGIGSDLANQHDPTQIQSLTDLTETDALDDLLSTPDLLPHFPTSLSDNNVGHDMEMDLLDAHTSSGTQPLKDGSDPFADLSAIWSPYTSYTSSQQRQHTIPFNGSQQTMGLYEADKPLSPLTPSSLLNPDIFDKQRDTSTSSGSSSTASVHDNETNAQIQNLLNQLLALSTKDSSQSGDQMNVALGGRTAGDGGKYFLSEPRSPEYKSTVTFTDLDNVDDSTDSTIVDLVTQSASKLQNEMVTDKDLLSMLEEDNWLQQQQQQQQRHGSKYQDKQNVSSYWVNHEDDDDEYRVEMGDGSNRSIDHQNALVNYTGSSSKSGTNTAISGDMRMRALDQLSGVQAIRQLLSKKKLSVKDIVRQMLIQNRDMHMLQLAQEEDRKKIENQRAEINSLRKKQDDMMSIILDLQKLMISSGFMSRNVNSM